MNGYNFTQRVRHVLMRARDEAMSLAHEYVGTEHILLGLASDSDGVAVATLANLDAAPGRVREELLATLQRGTAQPAGPDLPYTGRAKKTLELAMQAARDLNHSYVGTEHLLLGLLLEEKNIAAQVLASLGVTFDKARAEVLRILGTETTANTVTTERAVTITLVVETPDGQIQARKFRSSDDATQFLRQFDR